MTDVIEKDLREANTHTTKTYFTDFQNSKRVFFRCFTVLHTFNIFFLHQKYYFFYWWFYLFFSIRLCSPARFFALQPIYVNLWTLLLWRYVLFTLLCCCFLFVLPCHWILHISTDITYQNYLYTVLLIFDLTTKIITADRCLATYVLPVFFCLFVILVFVCLYG